MDAFLKVFGGPLLAALLTGWATVKAVDAKLEVHVSYISQAIQQLNGRVATLERKEP